MTKNLTPKDRLLGIAAIIIGLAGLLVSLSLTLKPLIFPQAAPAKQPKIVRLSNFSPNSVTVSWVTDQPVLVSINHADNPQLNSQQVAFDDRGGNVFSKIHHLTLTGLKPTTTYYFELVSGGQKFDSQGQPYSVSTPAELDNPGLTPIILANKLTTEALVYFKFPDSTLISTITDAAGNYQLDLSKLLTEDQKSYYPASAAAEEAGTFSFHDGQTTVTANQLPKPASDRKSLTSWWRSRRSRPQVSQVKITNVTDSSLAISWLTNEPTEAAVALSRQPNRYLRFLEFFFCQYFSLRCQLFADEINSPSTTHFVTLRNLQPDTSYYYRLVADNRFLKHDANDQILPALKTASMIDQFSLPQPIFSPIFEANGITPVKNALVYINLLDAQDRNIIKSQPIMTYTDNNGVWLVNLSDLRSFDRQSQADLQPGDLLFIKVWAADGRQTAEFIPYQENSAMPTLIIQ